MAKKKRKKPILLYTAVILLTAAVLFMGGLTFLSAKELASIKENVNELTAKLDELAAATYEIAQKATDLENGTTITSGEVMGPMPNTEETAEDTEEESEEGTLSPNTGSSFTEETDADMDNLLSQIKNLLPTNNGNWSVYVCNLQTGSEGSISNKPMQSASLIKLFIMGAIFERYDAMINQYGQSTIDNLVQSMITISDNDATNTLVGYLGNGDTAAGMNVVNEFCKAHGYTNTSMGRLMLQSNENGDNYTSAADCGRFLKEVYNSNNGSSEISTLARTDVMYELLKGQTRRNKIPAQIPDGVGIANKTGELTTVENDAGIIYNTAKGVDLVIVYMSENLTATGSAQTIIAEQSRMIYGFYNE